MCLCVCSDAASIHTAVFVCHSNNLNGLCESVRMFWAAAPYLLLGDVCDWRVSGTATPSMRGKVEGNLCLDISVSAVLCSLNVTAGKKYVSRFRTAPFCPWFQTLKRKDGAASFAGKSHRTTRLCL